MARVDRIKGKFVHGVLVIPVELNGISLDFMVDSGASFCAVNKRVADKMDLLQEQIRSLTIAPATGKSIKVPLIRVDFLRVGFNAMKNVEVTILDFPVELRFRGLLGMNFLRNFRFTIEPDTATLVLRKIPK